MRSAGALPTIWVLLGSGAGGNGQMRSLAEALGWPFEEKRLVYNSLNHLPNIVLGASLVSVDREHSSPLAPPWPDLVIAASRRSAPVARWIRKQSGGRTRLVHLLHAQAPLHWFDLVITTPQYRLPELPNVLHNLAPLNHVPAKRLTEAAAQWAPKLAELPRPRTALLVGGNSSSYELDAEHAARLGREASAYVRAQAGSLLVTTSPRTPPAAVDALWSAIDCPAYKYRWQANDADNPYFGFLAVADGFIVTVDSASLLVEACATGKPVAVFEWPRRGRTATSSNGNGGARRSALYDGAVYWGLFKPARDFDRYHRAVRERGFSRRLGEPVRERPSASFDDLARAVARIRELMGRDDERQARSSRGAAA
jgi:mitochondrial fission protein ELM1